jgi:hypothetical protein
VFNWGSSERCYWGVFNRGADRCFCGLPSSIPEGNLTGVQKREYVNEVNNVPKIPIYRGNADRAKLPHGYVAEKTNPGASELKKPIVFRSIGFMQRSLLIPNPLAFLAVSVQGSMVAPFGQIKR